MQQRVLSAILVAIEERLTAIEEQIAARSAPSEQVEQALKDILSIYNDAGQIREVVSSQRNQIQALSEAYERLSLSLKVHHESSSTERHQLQELMSEMHLLLGSLVSVARGQAHSLADIGRAVGADLTPGERARRDVRPEEQHGRDG